MKRTLIATAAVAALFSATAWAQMGPGMMGGYGSGGMGSGMRGPGMMGGYGMGPGMMGPGMMGGHGMGRGMMGGYGWGGYGGLSLNDEQRAKIAAIQEESTRKQRELMGKMHEQRHQLLESESSDKSDAAARKTYQAMSEAHKAMFEASLDVRKRIDAVLTKEQREQLQSGRHCG